MDMRRSAAERVLSSDLSESGKRTYRTGTMMLFGSEAEKGSRRRGPTPRKWRPYLMRINPLKPLKKSM